MAGSIRKRGSSFAADITIKGKRKTKTFPTEEEALRWLELQRPRPPQALAQAAPACRFTLAQAMELSLRVRWTDRQTGEPKPYKRTAQIYCAAACDFFDEECLVSEITSPRVVEWREHLLAGGNRPATVNRKVSALSAMLSDACEAGHLDRLPALPQQLSCNNTRDRVISSDERAALAGALVRLGHPEAADFFEFLMETAARFGESSRLRGHDVDLARRTVTFWKTKSGKPRTVPLTSRAVESLRPHMPAVPSQRIFLFSYGRFKLMFQRAKDLAGIDDPGLIIHSTRHTCATRLATAGVPTHQLMAYGGWTSLASVQRYLHLQTRALEGCVAALEA